jgi:uncharacterized membrane protein YoaK (UPF0700 family)
MDSPSGRIVAAAAEQFVVRDALGRQVSVRRLSALDRLRLFKAVGPDLAQNAPYFGMAMLAASVTAIDGVPVPAPMREGQLEALVQLLGDEGLSAAADAFSEDTPETVELVHAGNSAGTPI